MDLEEGGNGVEWLLALSPGAGPNWASLLCLSCWLALPPEDSLDPDCDEETLEEAEEEAVEVVA